MSAHLNGVYSKSLTSVLLRYTPVCSEQYVLYMGETRDHLSTSKVSIIPEKGHVS